jgi:signal transduction histidine kinase/HAMP domain-containing protein
VRLATRLFVGSGLIILATVVTLVAAAGNHLRRGLELETAEELERDARLVAALLVADSAAWPEEARRLGALIDRRITLVDVEGRVRGDTEFDRASLARLENHGSRPEIAAAAAHGVGRDRRVSASTNAPQLYVAVRGGPATLAAVRVSAPLDAVAAHVGALQRAVVGAGVFALVAAAALAWLASVVVARPLVRLGDAARDIAAGRPPAFPESRIPEVARHIMALRSMHEELGSRFTQLQHERQETHAVLDAMTDGVIVADRRGDVTACNAAGRRLLAFRDGAPLPPVGELFHEKRARDLLRRLVAGADVEQEELEVEGRTLLATGRTLPDGGTLLVLRDVTALRRLEHVRRDFVANVSHELKTPLTSIVGYAETLSAESAGRVQTQRFADTILGNARRMQQLVDDLLDLSRIESGGWEPATDIVELEPVVGDAWAPFTERAAAAGVAFEVAVAPDAHAVPVDRDALRQVLTNLFDNALRHTPASGRIRVVADLVQDSVRLSVADTGSGIPAEHLPRIFERFYRVDPGRSREQGGTGLGLSIVKHLVEAHGGRVEAESTLGRGTTIRMTFPPNPPA